MGWDTDGMCKVYKFSLCKVHAGIKFWIEFWAFSEVIDKLRVSILGSWTGI